MDARMYGGNDKDTAVYASPTGRRSIVILAYDGVEGLDVAGPAGVFDRAEALRPGSYEVIIASLAGGPVATSGTLCLAATRALADVPPGCDTVLVAGGSEAAVAAATRSPLVPWLARAASATRRIGSVCTGAFLLGRAGLLDGRRCTTHWRGCADLQRMFPTTVVDADAIYTVDGVYTSAGVTAGIDLALALVADDLGDAVAADIARDLVVYLRRSGGQSQYSRVLAAQAAASPRLRGVVQWTADRLDQPIRVADMAMRAGMSERNFIRLFGKEIGATPAQFVMRARVEQAQDLLERSGWPLERVAERCGFGSIDSLQRAFKTVLGISPSAHRARFASAE
jgi:transcriptional regulator GlxA family with amidase domain